MSREAGPSSCTLVTRAIRNEPLPLPMNLAAIASPALPLRELSVAGELLLGSEPSCGVWFTTTKEEGLDSERDLRLLKLRTRWKKDSLGSPASFVGLPVSSCLADVTVSTWALRRFSFSYSIWNYEQPEAAMRSANSRASIVALLCVPARSVSSL